MAARPPTSKAPRATAVQDRSAAPASKEKYGSLRWVRDVLTRSIRLEQGRNQGHGALVDSRRAPGHDQPLTLLMQQRAALGARLLVHDPATQPVRNLFVVHDELGSRGWAGVGALPLPVVGRALTEAEILGSQEPSPLLTTIIEGLRELTLAADQLAAHRAHEALEREWEKPQMPEVSETNYDEYELMERSWVGTVPGGLDLSDHATQ